MTLLSQALLLSAGGRAKNEPSSSLQAREDPSGVKICRIVAIGRVFISTLPCYTGQERVDNVACMLMIDCAAMTSSIQGPCAICKRCLTQSRCEFWLCTTLETVWRGTRHCCTPAESAESAAGSSSHSSSCSATHSVLIVPQRQAGLLEQRSAEQHTRFASQPAATTERHKTPNPESQPPNHDSEAATHRLTLACWSQMLSNVLVASWF